MTNFLTNIFKLSSLILVFICLFLSACGGTSANGVGGTGITQGRVTGFGSMFVNGVKFDTDNATFTRDGISSKKQEDFNTGEIVTIKGTVNEGRKTGIAQEVIFSDTLEGSITTTPTSNRLEVLGQTVIINNLTIFHGFNNLNELTIGNIVEISGFTTNGKVTATSVQLINASFGDNSLSEIEGEISKLNTDSLTFEINGLVIDYTNSDFVGINEGNLSNSLYLVVTSDQDIQNNTLEANRIQSFDNSLEANTYYELEGFVTELGSTNDFILDDTNRVSTSPDTIFTNGSLNDITINQLLIVTGTTNAEGVLIADEVRITGSSSELLVETTIESIDIDSNNFVILGRTIEVDNFTLITDDTSEDFSEFSLNNFAVGDSVYVDISFIDGEYFANRLSKIETVNSVYLEGTVESVDNDNQKFSISDLTVSTENTTSFFNNEGESITCESFFSNLEEGVTELQIEAIYDNSQQIVAAEITIFD